MGALDENFDILMNSSPDELFEPIDLKKPFEIEVSDMNLQEKVLYKISIQNIFGHILLAGNYEQKSIAFGEKELNRKIEIASHIGSSATDLLANLIYERLGNSLNKNHHVSFRKGYKIVTFDPKDNQEYIEKHGFDKENFFFPFSFPAVPNKYKSKPSFDSPESNGRKIGRNDICFCGSGKKYKFCHGRSFEV